MDIRADALKRHTALLLTAGIAFAGVLVLVATSAFPSRADDISTTNMVEQFQSRLDAGTAKLEYANDGHGYLPAVLRAFRIPQDSQLLVFSGSSLQFDRINQKTPRALYFQNDMAVGSVQDGHLIEIITTDKDSGIAFYTLDVAKADKPKFVRRTSECIICHGFAGRWSPGLMVANMDTGPNGQLLNLDPSHTFRLTDDRTPFDMRYGGWYVTGKTGAMQHRGNVTLSPGDPATLPPGGLNIPSLADRIEANRYLEPGSDIVSLLTLEHQAGFVNLIGQINAQYRGLDNTAIAPTLRATKKDVDSSIEELVRYMTFADEVPLPSPVTGSSDFTNTFSKAGPNDDQGRSLRDFDLKTRLFRYPLSYMVYSQAFDDLNPIAKDRLLRRLYAVLSGADHAPGSLHIDHAGGAAAIAIFAATKPNLPDYWKPVPEKRS
jgi:hypothetical protein